MHTYRTLKRTLTCGAAAGMILLASAGHAVQAQDMDAAKWSGFYFGVDIGYGFANASGVFDPSEQPPASWSSNNGILGGVHIGHDWQMDGFVLGLEADVSATGLKAKACHSYYTCGASGSSDAVADLDLLGSVRARLGMLIDSDNLLYATGGLAFREGDWKTVHGYYGLRDASKFDKVGGVIGGGWEYRVNGNMSVRMEGLYYFFGKATAGSGYSSRNRTTLKFNPVVIRAGINMRM